MSQYDTLFPASAPSDGNPFAIRDLWRNSSFTHDPSDSALFSFSFTEPEPEPTISTKQPSDALFQIPPSLEVPHLPGLDNNPWKLPSFLSDSFDLHSDPSTVADEDLLDPESESYDIWRDPETTRKNGEERYYQWDSFLVEGANSERNGYLTEAGPAVLDAALQTEGDSGYVVRSDIFGKCLLHLGLGRSSVLFRWDRRIKAFRPVKEGLRVSGTTAGAMESIVKTFAECGGNIRMLQKFSEEVYKDYSASRPALVALAKCATTILESVQKRLSISSRTVQSLLHLRAVIRDPALIVEAFAQIISAVKDSQDDTQLLSRLFDAVQQQNHKSAWLKPLLVETLARVSRPWLEFVEQWIGLDAAAGGIGVGDLIKEGSFVGVEEETRMDENGREKLVRNYHFEKSQIPSFVSAEMAETVFETGRSLRFLEAFHPAHPLAIAGKRKIDAPKLNWRFDWKDVEGLQQQAKEYEQNLKEAIQKYTNQEPISPETDDAMDIDPIYVFETFGKTKDELNSGILASLEAMSKPLPPVEDIPANTTSRTSDAHNSDHLSNLVLNLTRLSSITSSALTTFSPPLPITPLLSFTPVLTTQCRLISSSCLKMFFTEHSLLSHLSILRQFHLFGSGVFSSLLSSALFDPDLDSTERIDGTYRSGGRMGLKLGSRDTWPPASSELRLALMDVLTRSIDGTSSAYSLSNADLPGGLSFAVREMSDQELEACMDADSIFALDFLKLEYVPPEPLGAVITPTALWRYDKIFRLLLRVRRMVFVVGTLWKGGAVKAGGGIEARHFVVTLANYLIESGIGTTWQRFESRLATLAASAGAGGETLDHLRQLHEGVLDRIMFATLSRKRQQPVMKIVDEIFGMVLRFARLQRMRETNPGEEDDGQEVERLYKAFRRRVGIFIGVCRGLSEKRGYGEGRKDAAAGGTGIEGGFKEEANLLGMLLLGLEMGGYYSKGGRG
ncbi:Spc98 family-domain-containing protein [Pyronema domesticum]|nr:Spc98 family-domain-containing protein [Pyronema domesticum]